MSQGGNVAVHQSVSIAEGPCVIVMGTGASAAVSQSVSTPVSQCVIASVSRGVSASMSQ
jgi:hypothetical protein